MQPNMPVLPSFQSFLQSTTQASSPSMAMATTSSSTGFYLQPIASPVWDSDSPLHSRDSFSSYGSWTDEEDSEYRGSNVSSPSQSSSHGLHHRLPRLIGLDAVTSLSPIKSSKSSFSASKRVKKKYLKERERCEIVFRVRAGEKQAHLAKEFGVSRAAVCYLLKHQMEILRRSSERV